MKLLLKTEVKQLQVLNPCKIKPYIINLINIIQPFRYDKN